MVERGYYYPLSFYFANVKFDSSTMRDKQQLTIDIPKFQNLKLKDTFFFIGSCFSTEISSRLTDRLIPSNSNPFGTVFNPVTILDQLRFIFSEDHDNLGLTHHENTWHALNLSYKFQSENKDELIQSALDIAKKSREHLSQANHIIITLGSSFTWHYKKLNSTIGNCHKIPQAEFSKQKLSFKEICYCLRSIISLLSIHTKATLTFTLSPVRYLREGIINNTISKSFLRSGIQEVIEENESVNYFPSYEIFTEELKDHRYYKRDLAHPNDWSSDYIFLRWIETQADEKFQQYFSETQLFHSLNSHRTDNLTDEQKREWFEKIDNEKSRLNNYYHQG